MPTHPTRQRDLMLSAAHVLARSTGADARFGGLLAAVAEAVDGRLAVVYLRDIDTGDLYPAAIAGAAPLPEAEMERVDGATDDASAAAVREQREVLTLRGGQIPSALLQIDPSLDGAIHVPLVAESPAGGTEVEGVIAVGYQGAVPSPVGRRLLAGVASLAAVAALQSRLEVALHERSDWLERLAHTDALTGLANRRAFVRVLEHELARATRSGSEVSLAMFDVDRLGAISAAHGEQVGDDILRRVGAALAETVRMVDTVARYERDTFVVLAPGSAGMVMARRATNSIARLEPVAGDEAVTVSVGVARYPGDGATAAELLAAADRALEAAKARGVGTILDAGGGGPDAA
jgi:diguanylate cyclase (GGDEF)-like protein